VIRLGLRFEKSVTNQDGIAKYFSPLLSGVCLPL